MGQRRLTALGRLGTILVTLVALSCGTPQDSASAAWRVTGGGPAAGSAITVMAPGNVSTSATCSGTAMTVHVSWTASSSPGVNGYRVTLRTGTGQTLTEQTDATTTTLKKGITKPNAGTAVSVTATVTTLTTYGWTAESPVSAPASC